MVQQDAGCLLFFRIQADGRLRFAGDSVAEVAAVDEAKVEIGLVFQQVQVACYDFVGIAINSGLSGKSEIPCIRYYRRRSERINYGRRKIFL